MNGWRRFGFALLMLALTGLFIGLGVWQVERLGEKEALIARVAERMGAAPVDLPPSAEWEALDPATLDYAPLRVAGHFVPQHSIMVFTSLGDDAQGQQSGPGYWVITPLALDTGGSIFVNRGFIPQDRRADFVNGQGIDETPQTLIGIARQPEKAGTFTPEANLEDRIDYVRDPERLWLLTAPSLGPFAPVTLDLPAGAPGTLPQGGETVVEFPNNHLGYAMTWFGFALITPILLVFWLRRQRPAKPT
jgi:surfeit locus 1 family protein